MQDEEGQRVELLADIDRPGGWLLLMDRIRQSYVDLDDPSYLDFEYVQAFADVIDALPAGPLAVTHVGKGNTHGPIELNLLNGSDVSAPVVVNSEISADLDLDLASLGDRVVIAWSDHRRGETRVYTAAVDESGKLIAPPAPAREPPCPQTGILFVTRSCTTHS